MLRRFLLVYWQNFDTSLLKATITCIDLKIMFGCINTDR